MRVLEPGHIYELDNIDGDNKPILNFVNREVGTEHQGTQTQEVLRCQIDSLSVLIDRTNHCDSCLRWEGNYQIIKYMSDAQRLLRLALLKHEHRAMERKMDKHGVMPEKVEVAKDGHFIYPR